LALYNNVGYDRVSGNRRCINRHRKNTKLENVAINDVLPLKAARRYASAN